MPPGICKTFGTGRFGYGAKPCNVILIICIWFAIAFVFCSATGRVRTVCPAMAATRASGLFRFLICFPCHPFRNPRFWSYIVVKTRAPHLGPPHVWVGPPHVWVEDLLCLALRTNVANVCTPVVSVFLHRRLKGNNARSAGIVRWWIVLFSNLDIGMPQFFTIDCCERL